MDLVKTEVNTENVKTEENILYWAGLLGLIIPTEEYQCLFFHKTRKTS